MKDFGSNIGPQLGVVGFPDFSHAAASQTLAQLIFSKVVPVAIRICTHSSPYTPEDLWFYLYSSPGNYITSKQEGYTTISILSVEEVPINAITRFNCLDKENVNRVKIGYLFSCL